MKLICIAVLMLSSIVHAETCELQTYVSSWMKSGYAFTVKCPDGVFTGTIKTTAARHWSRRGALYLLLDAPQFVHGNTDKGEGKFQAGKGKMIANMFLATGSGIGSKDIFDGLSNAIFKSWFLIPIVGVPAFFFQKGSDINLAPGTQLDVEPTR
jgi:hypothetical protein